MRATNSLLLGLGLTGLCAGVASAQIQFQPATSYGLFGQRPDWAAIGDFDGVNGPDFAVTTGGPQGANAPEYVEIFNNQGGGTFVAGQQIFMGNNVGVAAAVAGDLDGDGDMDLAVSLKDAGTVQVLFNTGGVFSLGGSTSVNGSEPRHMVGGDIDGDGDMDLITSNRDSNNLSVLMNGGAGAFSFGGLISVGAEPRYIALAPLNGDPLPDLAVAAHDDRRVDVLMNTGGGAFGGLTSYSVPGNEKPSGMTAADLDGDGDMDLATTSDNNNFGIVAVFRNQGGTFTAQTFNTGGVNPGGILAGDLDLDGDMDLAAADEDANFVSALPNFGAGTFGAGTSFPVGSHPSHIAGADLDGNGSMDLVTPNRDSNSVSVLLNVASDGSIGTSYCGSNTNSTGDTATIRAFGTAVAAANDLRLDATGMPTNQNGIFLASRTQGFIANPGGSQGNVCLGLPIGRFNAPSQIRNTGGTGSFSLTVDTTNIPMTPPVAILAGETWNFQAWYRDNNPTVTSNFTDGVSVLFQ